MTLLKRVVGWISWLSVATTGYLVVALGLDSDLRPALPEPVYEWLDSTFEPGSPEASYDLEIWTTGGAVVLAMHVVALVLILTLSRLCLKGWAWKSRWQRFSKVVGWTCWFLVATEIIVGIADEVVRAFAIEVPDARHLPLLAFVGSSVVCALMHGAVFRFMRTRAEVARKCPG